MEQIGRKIDLTWILYLAYGVLMACSMDWLPEGFITPAIWALTGMLILLNSFLVLGVMMMVMALKQLKTNTEKFTLTVDGKKQIKFLIVLSLELIVIYLLAQSPQIAPHMGLIINLVVSKVIFTAIFLTLHRQIRSRLKK